VPRALIESCLLVALLGVDITSLCGLPGRVVAYKVGFRGMLLWEVVDDGLLSSRNLVQFYS
jgi:hypothetical protein